MTNYMWKHRIVLGLLVILLVQVPFVYLKLTFSDRESVYALVEATQHEAKEIGAVPLACLAGRRHRSRQDRSWTVSQQSTSRMLQDALTA